MLSVTSAQLEGWLALLAFPMARILGFVGAAPVFGNNAVPRRIKLMVGLAITLGLLPVVPSAPPEAIDSWAGILILFQQLIEKGRIEHIDAHRCQTSLRLLRQGRWIHRLFDKIDDAA